MAPARRALGWAGRAITHDTRQKAGALTPSTYITMVAIEIALKTQTLIGGGGYIVIVIGEHDHW
jgi:hypothetical protein